MNKTDLIDSTAREAGLTKADAKRALDAMLDVIVDGLKKDEKIEITGFGTFSVAERAARSGRNPRTGETIEIGASKTAKFKPGKRLKEEIK